MKRSHNRFLTCPWCKQKMVIKTRDPYGQNCFKCQNCGSWCYSIFVYFKKRIQYFFD